jgi:hypothetical protein
MIGRSDAALSPRLTLLLRLATGEVGPLGPVAERAKAEVIRLLRLPDVRTELAAQPHSLETMKSLMVEAGLAA